MPANNSSVDDLAHQRTVTVHLGLVALVAGALVVIAFVVRGILVVARSAIVTCTALGVLAVLVALTAGARSLRAGLGLHLLDLPRATQKQLAHAFFSDNTNVDHPCKLHSAQVHTHRCCDCS